MTAFRCHVEIRGLDGVADPAGRTIERALPALGFRGVSGVHVGKVISFVLEASDEEECRAAVQEMCAQLLANPVIERAEVHVAPLSAAG